MASLYDDDRPPTGRYDDLVRMIVRAEARRYRSAGAVPNKLTAAKGWLQLPLSGVGRAISGFSGLLGEAGRLKLNQLLWLASGSRGFVPSGPQVRRAAALYEEGLAKGSTAVLGVMSHPPVDGEALTLNVDMSRSLLSASFELTGRTPQLVIAVDAYAVDMLGDASEALYCGYMSTAHLGLDRLAHMRPAGTDLFVRDAAWHRVPWRLLRRLRAGLPSALVLGGGVAKNARVLYASREFLVGLYQKRPMDAREVRRRLLNQPNFREFLELGWLGERLRVNPRRLLEAWAMAASAGLWPRQNVSPAQAGEPTPDLRAVLAACAHALGYTAAEFDDCWPDFEQEFRRQTPWRPRFFAMLARRVVARGTRVLLLPLSHAPKPAWRDPVLLTDFEDGKIGFKTADQAGREPIQQFARRFSESNFP